MKRLTFLFLTVALFACGHKDQSKNDKKKTRGNQDAIIFPFLDSLNWKGIEKQNDALKDQFINSHLKEFSSEDSAYNNEFHSVNDLRKDLHVYDFNNDGSDDLIFCGQSGGEPFEVAFILKTESGFKIVFKDFQHLKKMTLENNRVSRIFINDDGCCDAYVDFNKAYDVDYSKPIPKFTLIYLTANFHGGYFPDKYLDQPINFEVLNNNYKLRSAPKIDDTVSVGYGGEDHKGNTIGLLKIGTKGHAIATKTDNIGREWWLVELNPSSKINGSIFYEPEDTKRISSKMGWISSRFVKVLN